MPMKNIDTDWDMADPNVTNPEQEKESNDVKLERNISSKGGDVTTIA
jgi:hypothetical protein